MVLGNEQKSVENSDGQPRLEPETSDSEIQACLT